TGDNFVARTVVQLDGAPLATTFVSTTELRATIPTSSLLAVGTLRLSAGTSPPGGGASKEVDFNVVNPAPTLTTLAPMSVVAGTSSPVSLHLTGSGFVTGAKVVYGSTDLTTTYDSMTDLDATIPAGMLATSGSVPVKVVNPAPGGGDSTTIAFTVSNPNASIQNVTPSTAFVGSAPVDVIVTGGGFVAASVVQFNAVSLATTFVSGSEVHATIPAAQLVNAGDFPVVVNNPPPGGGPTAPFTFHVVYPAPIASSLAPNATGAGAAPTMVTVTGSNFFAASQITFDGAPAATTYVDGSHLGATLTAAQLSTGKTIAVRVVTPSPGGGASGALSFTVTNPVPTIAGLNPSSVTAGSPNTPIVVSGTGFLAASTVQSNGVAIATTFNSSTQLTATVPSGQLLFPGSVSITVTNPAPGGGTSTARTLSIGCDSSGVDVQLTSVGQTTTLATNFAAAGKASAFFADAMNPWDGSCTTTQVNTADQEPARYWVVQNTTGASITLSAWAVCTADGKQDDAFLTYYRRPTPPTTDDERFACVNEVSEGLN
ncbi:MAG TPA: IPT/TIG domain-containing protein, partial [Labilithrix sp.]